jgi:translation elongation factor EF-Ts
LAYIPEMVMNCDVDYVNKPEKYKCLGNTIDGNIFNKHNDQEKKDISEKDDRKRINLTAIIKIYSIN